MKKILLSIFGILTLGLINFSSAGSYTYTGNFSKDISNLTFFNSVSLPFPLIKSPTHSISVSCVISNFSTDGNCSIKTSGNRFDIFHLSLNSVNINSFGGNGTYSFTLSNPYSGLIGFRLQLYTQSTCNGHINFDYSCTISGDEIINQSDLNNYSQCTSDLSSCQLDLSICNSDYNSCESSLTNITLDYQSCQSDLSTCQNSSSSCSPSGNCTVSNKVSENIIFSGSKSFNTSYSNMFDYGTEGAGTYCLKFTSSNPQTLTMGFANGPTTTPTNLYSLYNDQYGNTICLYGNKPYLNVKLNSSSNTINYEVYKLTDLLSDDIPCAESSTPECEDWTQLQCESEYDLIPESSITSEYCEENFNLIDPENCPSSGGTGDVNWSSFFVNSHQVQGASSIYLWLPDFLNWDYTYIDSGSTLEIDVENEGDQEYINNILDIQSYHPDKDQFAMSFAGFLTLLMPYIIITLFIIFVWKLIKRIFR